MNKTVANKILKRMQEIVKNEFPEYNAEFARTTFTSDGQINFKFKMVSHQNKEMVKNRDTEIGMIKNNVRPNAIGKNIDVRGESYQVISVRPRKQKYPVVAKRIADGKLFRLTAQTVNEAISNW